MAKSEQNCRAELKPGQLWKIEHGYIYIVELGIKLIRYQLLGEEWARRRATQVIGLEPLVNFLRHTQARLVDLPAWLGPWNLPTATNPCISTK